MTLFLSAFFAGLAAGILSELFAGRRKTMDEIDEQEGTGRHDERLQRKDNR